LGAHARALVEREDEEVGISAISAWEVATLARLGRIVLDRAPVRWVAQALAGPRVVELPVTGTIAAAAGSLDDAFPGDPADRLIYATALAADAVLVTRDRAISAYDPRRTVW
jgi:PIN domain nuclease of toxin-antitoxin system